MKKSISIIFASFLISIILFTSSFQSRDFNNDDQNEICLIESNPRSSSRIFDSPELIENAQCWSWPEIFDYDDDGYPDIIYSNRFLGEENGLYHTQMNSAGDWTHSRINDMEHFLLYSNLTGSSSKDFLNLSAITNQMSMNLTEISVNGEILSNITFDLGDYIQDITSVDIDADGDYDVVFGYQGNYVQVYQNLGNGSFNPDWDDGIPDRFKDTNLPNLFTRQVETGDLNNDGMIDICTAMRNGAMGGMASASRYFNWISEGNGSWVDSSEGFPGGDKVLFVDIADLDNDGDLDYGVLTESSGSLFENIDGRCWEKQPFPNYNRQMTDFVFEDVDLDGFVDILTVDSKWITDTKFVGKLNISFGKGDFSWINTNQFNTSYGPFGRPHFEDFDRDGDKDMIFESFSYLFYCENVMNNKENISFMNLPTTTHFRSGQLTQPITWTMRDGHSICKNTENLEFNFSISYTGPDGPFLLYKEIEGQWWTDLIIPDICSNDVYFKIDYASFEAIAGPYTIHNSEGMGSMIELVDPEYGSYLYDGEDVNVTFKTSSQVQGGDLPIYLNWGKGNRTHVGTYRFESGVNNTFQIIVPSNITALESSFEVGISWYGMDRIVNTNSRVNIISNDSIPGRFLFDNCHLMAGYVETVEIQTISLSGITITHDCDYEVLFRSKGINVHPLKNGRINISCDDVGEYNFTLGTTRFFKRILQNITVISHPPIQSIFLQTDEDDPRVGEEMEIFLRGKDPDGDLTYISEKYVNWSISGDCSFATSGGGILLTPHSANDIDIEVIVDAGLGPITGSMTVEPESTLLDVTIRSDSDQIMNGTMASFNADVRGYNFHGIEGYTLDWSTGSNGLIVFTDGDDVDILVTEAGSLSVSVIVTYFNESISNEISIDVTPSPFDIIPERDLVQEVGTSETYDLEVVTDNGEQFAGDVFISPLIKDPSIASASVADSILTLIGEEEGETILILNLSTDEGISFERSFPVTITSMPVEILIDDHPSFLRIGESIIINLSVENYMNDPITDYSMEVETDLSGVEILEEGSFRIDADEIGNEIITISVEKYGETIQNNIELEIIQVADSLTFDYDPEPLPVGEDIIAEISLLDRDGIPIIWDQFDVSHDEDLNIENINGTLRINTSSRGRYEIEVITDHYGLHISNSFNVSFYEPSILSEIIILDAGHDNIFEVVCLDQFGENITGECQIDWEGDLDLITPYKAELRTEKNTVIVSYNGTELEREITASIEDSDGGIPFFIPLLLVMIFLIIAGVLVFHYLKRKNDGKDHIDDDNTQDFNDRLETES